MNTKSKKDKYKIDFNIVREELNLLDPMGLSPGKFTPIDEYNVEIETILIKSNKTDDYSILAKEMQAIFNKMFDENFKEEMFYDCAKRIIERTQKK